jgi:hypothetical protein
LSAGRALDLTDYSSSPLSNADEVEEEEKDEDQDNTQTQSQTQGQEPDDSDSDEEDQPLALMNGSKPQAQPPALGRHSGKKAAGHMTVAGTAPAPQTANASKKNVEAAGVAGKSKTKPEELGEEQLQRLATGVTVDAEGENVQVIIHFCATRSTKLLAISSHTTDRLSPPC